MTRLLFPLACLFILPSMVVSAADLAELEKSAATQPSAEAYLRVAAASPDPKAAAAAYAEAFRLDPANVVAAKALLEKSAEQGPAQIAWFEAVLSAQPVEAVGHYYFAHRFMYGLQKEFPRLAAKIEAASFPPVPENQRLALENTFFTIMSQMRFAAQTGAVEQVLKKACAIFGPHARVVRQQSLLQLVERGAPAFRESRAADWLLPDPAGQGHWSERQPIFEEQALQLAREAGLEPALLQRALLAAPRFPEARGVAFFLRTLDRDPAVLPEIIAFAKGNKTPAAGSQWAMPTTKLLAEWPEGSAACLQMLTTYQAEFRSGFPGNTLGPQRLAQIALQAGQTGLAAETARGLLAEVQTQGRAADVRKLVAALELAITLRDPALLAAGNRLLIQLVQECHDPKEDLLNIAKRMAGLLLGARRFDEADALLKALVENPAAVKAEENASIRWTIIALQAERGLHKGEVINLSPIAWADASSTTQRAAIVWDVSVSRWSHLLPAVLFEGAPSAIEEGEDWEVVLSCGEKKDELREFARLRRVGARGVWRGAWPAAFGLLGVTLQRGNQRLTGPATPFVAGDNLWRELPAEKLQAGPQAAAQRNGSPEAEGSHFALAALPRMEQTVSVIGQPIKLLPGRQYEISGWLHHESDLTLNLGVRLLDADQKPLRTISHGTDLNPWRWWHYTKLRLSPSPREQGDAIPPEAVYLEPVVTTSGDACEVAGVAVVLVPE